jgi:hypothetical protein
VESDLQGVSNMKKLLVILTICVLPILAYSEFNPGIQGNVALPEAGFELPHITPPKPFLSISEALNTAQGYAQAKGVDVSGQYIHSVQLNYDQGGRRQGYYWHVQWAWFLPRMGGEYGLRVYTDGTVVPEPLGP